MWYSMQDGLSVCSASGDFKILRALYMKCFKSKAGATDKQENMASQRSFIFTKVSLYIILVLFVLILRQNIILFILIFNSQVKKKWLPG